ncbi:MAG: TolC family protein [Candidatus Sericytochromatia bacterium]|nr:TolC family protein [Candidatus Sericytochromatia bacterium]
MMGRNVGAMAAGLLIVVLGCPEVMARPAEGEDIAAVLLEAAGRQPSVRGARAAATAAEARETTANRGLWPVLGLSTGASVLQGQVFGAFAGGAAGGLPGGLGGLPLSPDQVWPTAAVTLSQPVFDGGRAWASGEAAAHARQGAELRAEDVRRMAVHSAWLAWLEALDREGDSLAFDARIVTARERVQRSRSEQQAGSGRELAVLEAESELARLEADRRQNAMMQALGLQDIRRRYGMALGTSKLSTLRLELPRDLMGTALPENRGVLAAEAVARAAEAHLRARQAGRWPQASAFVTATAAGKDLGISTTLGGANLSWQPLDFGRQGAAEQEARAQLDQALAEAEAARLDHQRNLQESLERRARGQAAVDRARSLLQLAFRSREQTEARRQNGTADALESLEREEAVVSAQVNLERTERDLLRAELALARALDLPPEQLLPTPGKR